MRKARAGEFPQPIQLGPNSIAFLADEIEAWMQDRVDARDEKLGEKQTDDRADEREAR
jgi:predicted DNA-binding transcriptional regulator AlpA